MKKLLIFLVLILLACFGIWRLNNQKKELSTTPSSPITQEQNPEQQNTELFTVVAQGLDTPWAIAFISKEELLVTERNGKIYRINTQGTSEPQLITELKQVKEIGEGGLLGITLHPDFSKNKFVYFYYTYSASGDNTRNRVVRMTYTNNTLIDEKIIIDKIPGASNHNGGRIKFGPDTFLYIGTGDAQEPSQAQDTNSLAGKILRVTDEGQSAPGNPFNNLVYSYGHRNVQGLTWSNDGTFFATEHGPSGMESGFDELNKIEKGKNYGWPTIRGDQTHQEMETPVKNSGATTTWAPSGIAFYNNSVFFGGLRGQTLYESQLKNNFVVEEHFKEQFGRIRDVVVGPDNMIYITTSNRDGRGNPDATDDKIIRINPEKL